MWEQMEGRVGLRVVGGTRVMAGEEEGRRKTLRSDWILR
jgi:hypothetical protein